MPIKSLSNWPYSNSSRRHSCSVRALQMRTLVTAWKNDMLQKNSTFMYWDLIMRFETLILICVRPQGYEISEQVSPGQTKADRMWLLVFASDSKSEWLVVERPCHSRSGRFFIKQGKECILGWTVLHCRLLGSMVECPRNEITMCLFVKVY